MATLGTICRDPVLAVIAAAGLNACSGIPGLFLGRRPGTGQRIAASAVIAAAAIGLAGSIAILLGAGGSTYTLSWTLPFGECDLAVDALSALFLIPVFLVSGAAALYAGAYWPAAEHRATEPLLTCSFGFFVAAMAMVVTARNGAFFLMAWEVMALAAFFAFTVEHRRREVRAAGTIYLVATHLGTLLLFLLFCLVRNATGSFLIPSGGTLGTLSAPATAIFLAALLGFGTKAGLMPMHVWLPEAHANAPSHISALMSGVMLNMGLYGIFRTVSLFDAPPLWWGILLLVAGGVSALAGIVSAIAEHDLKRLLAYSSIENIGIVTLGLGTALIALALNRPIPATLALTGSLLHMFNHSLFKPLLFFGAGTVIHASHTRIMDRMGGLASRMPWTAAFFLAGLLGICGLPPFNGFAGEFLLYAAFFQEATSAPLPFLALAAPLLAFIGGLAALCFARLHGIVFLGHPRSPAGSGSEEPGWRMLAPMGLLAGLCLAFGIIPQLPLALVRPAAVLVAPPLAVEGSRAAASLFGWLSAGNAGLLLLAALLALLLRRRVRAGKSTRDETWGCGYLNPAVSMQYTSSGFGEMMVRLFAPVLRPKTSGPDVDDFFPGSAAFRSRSPEILLERLIAPSCRGIETFFSLLRRIQHGEHQLYVLYIFATLFLLMLWGH